MTFSLVWLPDVLKAAGLKVVLVDGWESRGRAEMGLVKGVICHHTAGPKTGNMPSLDIVTTGRVDLGGPLSQLCLGRDGTFYVVAAGKANHAGKGLWQGITDGNASFIGIEAENTGKPDDAWPAVQMDAYRRGVAAILKHISQAAIMCCGHREYALPVGRKPDPSFDMTVFRSAVEAIMQGNPPSPVRPSLRRGATGDLVKQLQAKLRMPIDSDFGVKTELPVQVFQRERGLIDGEFGPKTEFAVQVFQSERGLVADGIVGPKTWIALDARSL
jgi:N-acetylmuramoyl-L-alanine amidase/Putative peptidoglycan binding domain